MKRRVLFVLALLIPCSLFLVARQFAAQRPLLFGEHRNARTLLLSQNGARLFSRNQSEVQIWDTGTRASLGTWKPPGFWMVPSPDGGQVVVASSPVTAQPSDALALTELLGSVRDGRSGAVICKFRDRWRHAKDVEDALQDLKWSDDGREILTLSNSALRRFDARDGHLIQRVFYAARNGSQSWLLSPGTRSIVVTDGKGAHFFSAMTGKETLFWKHPATATRGAPIGVSAVSPGGKWVLMRQSNAPNNATAFFVRASDGKLAWSKPQITTSTYGFEICGFSSDDQLVLSLEDARIVARYLSSGKEAWHLGAASIQNAVLSPDGQFVYSVDPSGTIRRWNAPSL